MCNQTTYINPNKFRREKLLVKKLSVNSFAEIWDRPKVCRAEIFEIIDFP